MDRKRRLTAPTSPGRRQGPSRVPSSSRMAESPSINTAFHPELPGSSLSNAIDLTSDDNERALPPTPPAPPAPLPPAHPIRRTSRPTVPHVTRQPSDIRLPQWQPDSEVAECPVCHNSFTFWYRKHHCRKCGRVVCANCSPHRITIPRQFIVRPPEPPDGILALTGDTSPTTTQTPWQMWGGEEVRVCNPCVPDPNLSPPPQYSPQTSPNQIPPENWRFAIDATAPTLRHPASRNRHSTGPLPPLPAGAPSFNSHRSTISDASSLAQAYNRILAQSQHMPGGSQRSPYVTHGPPLRDLYAPPSPAANPSFYPPRTSSAFGTSAPSHLPAPARPYHNRPMLDVDTRPARMHAPVPQRQIAEEDECPVCSEELPPKGPNGETTDRERHVEECIASRLYAPTPPTRTVSAPPEQLPEGSASATSSSAPIPNAPASTSATPSGVTPSSSTPLRQRRMTGGRMLVYKATEKDCVTEDGSEAECVICFEEFETGDEMGRLECLCRFHRTCIRQWWDTKGAGSCPTHQLHD